MTAPADRNFPILRMPLLPLPISRGMIVAIQRISISAGLLLAISCQEKSKPVAAAAMATATILLPDDQVHAGYSGSESCRKCHAAEFANWRHSHHGLAERDVDPDDAKTAFSPKRTLTHGEDSSEIFVDADGLAKILTEGLDKQRHAYQPVRVIGVDPLRQFLIPAPGGRLQTCDLSYDPEKNEWFDVYGDEVREPGDWGHWTGQGMNWNAMCATCHNTRVRKNYDPRTNSYATTMAEMSVSCESCHGPMKDHADWRENPAKKGADPYVPKFFRDQVMETCAACHARRAELTGDLIPGERFHDHFSLSVPDETDTFYPDGQVRDEDYEYTAFLASKMHHAGVRCADCHDPHTAKTISPGNQLCMNCHAGGRTDFPTAPVINPTAHSHHGEASAGNLCTSCHMPQTTYMQRDARHDHGFTIPDPKLTKEAGVPNACNRCHTDKDADWSILAMDKFYGNRPERATASRARLLAAARRGDGAAVPGMIALLGTEPIPLWRASISHLLTRWALDPAASAALISRLGDADPLVREAAVRALGEAVRQNLPGVVDSLKPLLDDPARAVRIAAAWVLCATVDLDSKAGRELVHMLDLNADQPTGRMQLAQFALLRGDAQSSIRQMRKAIAWDPNSPPFHHDLAVVLSTTGDSAGTISELEIAIRLDPENPDYHYKLALALNEVGATSRSTAEMEKSLTLDPGNARAWYNLGLARSAANQPQEAIEALLRAEAADGSDAGIPYALATVYARLGRKSEAMGAAARALQLRPDFPEAMQLIRAMR